MSNVTITVTRATPVVKTTSRGTILTTGDNDYVLYVGKDGNVNKAALVNVRTGEAIHTLKIVASADRVTAAELASLNFKKSSPAVEY
jgi:hypothetical protein